MQIPYFDIKVVCLILSRSIVARNFIFAHLVPIDLESLAYGIFVPYGNLQSTLLSSMQVQWSFSLQELAKGSFINHVEWKLNVNIRWISDQRRIQISLLISYILAISIL